MLCVNQNNGCDIENNKINIRDYKIISITLYSKQPNNARQYALFKQDKEIGKLSTACENRRREGPFPFKTCILIFLIYLCSKLQGCLSKQI